MLKINNKGLINYFSAKNSYTNIKNRLKIYFKSIKLSERVLDIF